MKGFQLTSGYYKLSLKEATNTRIVKYMKKATQSLVYTLHHCIAHYY